MFRDRKAIRPRSLRRSHIVPTDEDVARARALLERMPVPTSAPTCRCADIAAENFISLWRAYKSQGGCMPEALAATLATEIEREPKHHSQNCPLWVEWRDMRSWVYFIQVGQSGPVKVGHSKDPRSRFSSIQVGNHERLRLLCLMRGGEPVERSLHEWLKPEALGGEWFRPSARLRSIVWAAILEDEMQKGSAFLEAGAAADETLSEWPERDL